MVGLFAQCAVAGTVWAVGPGETPRAYWGSVPCEIVIDRYRDLCRSEHARLGVGENEILSPSEANQRTASAPAPAPAPPASAASASNSAAAASESAPPSSIAKPVEPPRVGPRDINPETTEAAHVAIDKLLATELKDPMSARQYGVSPIVQCARIVPAKLVHQSSPYCVCYQVNAKNAMGGYTGVDMGIASLFEIGQSYMAMSYDSALWSQWAVQVCMSAGFQSRDAALIHAAASR